MALPAWPLAQTPTFLRKTSTAATPEAANAYNHPLPTYHRSGASCPAASCDLNLRTALAPHRAKLKSASQPPPAHEAPEAPNPQTKEVTASFTGSEEGVLGDTKSGGLALALDHCATDHCAATRPVSSPACRLANPAAAGRHPTATGRATAGTQRWPGGPTPPGLRWRSGGVRGALRGPAGPWRRAPSCGRAPLPSIGLNDSNFGPGLHDSDSGRSDSDSGSTWQLLGLLPQ